MNTITQSMGFRASWVLALVVSSAWVVSACSSDEGGEGQPCYANQTCNEGLDCRSDTCVDLDGEASGVDLSECWSCADESCSTEVQSCSDSDGCRELLECQFGCGADANCLVDCDASKLGTNGALALSKLSGCAARTCKSECLDLTADPGSAGDPTGVGPQPPGDSTGLASCLTCGANTCTSEARACDEAPGCRDLIECQLRCGTAQGCISACDLSTLTATGAAALSNYYSCVASGCFSECSLASPSETPTPGTATPATPTATPTNPTTPPPVSGLLDGSSVWIDGMNNGVGIQGAFFVIQDSFVDGEPNSDGLIHTKLNPVVFAETDTVPCVSGTVAKVTNASGGSCELTTETCEWSAIWGGGIGLSLNETGGTDSVKSPWNASANGVTGFSFTTSGSIGGATLRFKARMSGSDQDFCAEVPVGSNSMALSGLQHNCFVGGTPSQTLDVTQITQLEWQIVPDASNSHPVDDFCITAFDTF